MALNLTSGARRVFLISATASILVLAACQTGPRRPVEPVEPPPTGLPFNGVAVIVPLTVRMAGWYVHL
jgi:hypothetical protein